MIKPLETTAAGRFVGVGFGNRYQRAKGNPKARSMERLRQVLSTMAKPAYLVWFPMRSFNARARAV